VFIVKSDHSVEYRAVTLGPMIDGLRVVRSGLKAGDQIVVSGLQRVRPGVVVDPVLAAMDLSVPTDKNAKKAEPRQAGQL
jgi:multidrug efflux system membrane fusion protein